MLLKIHKVKKYYVILFFAMMLDLGFFDLVNTSSINFMGIYYADMVFLFCISITLYEILKNKLVLKNFKVLFLICVLIIIAILSSYSADISYGQGLLSGIVAQREWISWVVLMYPISKWYKQKKITSDGLNLCIKYICRIYALICIAQYYLYSYVQFTYTIVSNRYGSVRLYFNSAFFAYTVGIIIDELFNENTSLKKKIMLLIEMMIYIYIIVFVTKGRMASIALLSALILCMCIRRNMKADRKIFLIFAVVVVIIAFSSTTMGRDIFATIVGNSTDNDTLSVRTAGKAYYISKTFSSVRTAIFGYGVPNIHNSLAMKIANPLWTIHGTARFYLDDVGIIGILFKYGLIGIGALIIISLICIVKAYKIYKKYNKMAYMQFILMDIITWSSLTPSLFTTSILMMMLITMLFNMDKENSSNT